MEGMMKRVLLISWILFISSVAVAQDFVARFLEKREADMNLKCISISPKMMEEVLKIDIERDSNSMLDMISNLKSMQMLVSETNGKKYFKEALALLEKNSERFQPLSSYKGESENCRIMVRKKSGEIVELVMLVNDNQKFVVINFTGNMSDEFIERITASMKIKRS